MWLLEKGVNVKAKIDDWGSPISSAGRFYLQICVNY